MTKPSARSFLCGALSLFILISASRPVRGEALLELFNVSWSELIQKMPEIAEAGYTALWLPNPAKGVSGTFSIGYDQFDPFDLGDKNQQGTTSTRYGTKAQLLQMVQTAHRFGIRVYFDNVMNHRGATVPGYACQTPTGFYPGLIPADFHLQTGPGHCYTNWNNIDNYCDQWTVQNRPLLGLVDLAQEPGTVNNNFGATLGSTITKSNFIRQATFPSYYPDTNLPSIGGGWNGFNGTNGQPVAELVEHYLTRAAMWTLYTTKCDGFRLDAVKHVPSNFFGNNTGGSAFGDDPSFAGYTGGIQAAYDWTHGYGNNVTGNGYVETDGNRNSLFDTEAPRNDAMIFGEHVSPVPDFQQYLGVGMRLCNQPLYNQMNTVLSGNAGFQGMDGRDYTPPPNYCNGTAYPCYSPAQSVMFPQTQDGGSCCPTHQELQDAYYFMHEGLPMIYSDGFNHSPPPNYFPILSYANYLGQFGDKRMPEIAYLHHQLSRGGTRSRWSDQNIVCWERYDYRDVSGNAFTNPDATVVLFAMNDNFGNPGDILFDDGITRTGDGYYTCANGSPSRGYGMVVGFPPGSVLTQMASTSTGSNRACAKLLVHNATTDPNVARSTATDPYAPNRAIVVNTTPPAGGGAVELLIPSGGWVMYAYQWPEASRANVSSNAINFRQGGGDVPRIQVYRHDGTNGDPNFNPIYPYKMRGQVDPNGTTFGGTHVSNLTYAIDIPVLTNAPFDISVRCDASATNILLKLDGGMDINSQVGLGPTNGTDLRDNRPGYVSDVFLGYEATAPQLRYGPEKFGARDISRDNVTSLGAETYYYTIGGSTNVVNGGGNGSAINTQTANWVYHDPAAGVTLQGGGGPATQRNPLMPSAGQTADVWVKVGYSGQINHCYIYYTTDGSNPEGAFGVGKGTTQVVSGGFVAADSVTSNIDWWKVTIPGRANGVQIRYKVALYHDNINPISDADNSKLYGLTQAGITNFNPTTAAVWLHNDLNTNNTAVGLANGFHIVRARCFLPRSGKSGVYNTFLQTFYYDAQLPTGTVAFPGSDGTFLYDNTYTVVVRADSSVTSVDFNIQDSETNNDDVVTGIANGNGSSNGLPVFVSAGQVTPDPTLNAQYPNYPQEFRFAYVGVPHTGSATITVRLKEFATSVFTNRFTTLTRTVNTRAPSQVLTIVNPSTDGTILTFATNSTYAIKACFSSTLTTNDYTLFSIYINGVLQPRTNSSGTVLYTLSTTGCGNGFNALSYIWAGSNAVPPITNVIEIDFTNQVALTATRTIAAVRPGDSDGDGMSDYNEVLAGTDPYNSNSVLRITGLANNNQLIVWQSVSNRNYQVIATTNLNFPLLPISPVIPGDDPSSFYFDTSPDPTNKFYRIQVVP